MALRKASAYSKKIARPFTRNSKSKKHAFIKVTPHSKITKLTGGKTVEYAAGKMKYSIKLISNEKVQIRDTSLEACRMFLSNNLEKLIPGQYFMALKVYPHHFLRENKTAAGAGADRISTGMSHSYGVVTGRAAKVRAGQEIVLIACENEKSARIARIAIDSIRAKVPCSTSVKFEIAK